jgi:hypothetical protein
VVFPLKLEENIAQRARWRSRTTLAATCCVVAAALTACASVTSGHTVSLLPDAGANHKVWQWTPTCRLVPTTPRACAISAPNVGSAQFTGDEWNLGDVPGTPGSVTMSVTRGALTVLGRIPSAPPCTDSTCIASSANTWVRGYPSVLYGINQCSASASPPGSATLRLPMRLSSIPTDLIGTTAYSSQTSHVTYDIAYDMWLNRTDTKTPCKKDGTVEVMVWTGYDQQALLPDSVKVGTATAPFSVNGTLHAGDGSWSVYASNVFGAGHTQPWGGTIWFVLNKADATSHGTVSVDLSTVLADAAALLQNNYGWSDVRKNYWLDTIPFGIEFGPQSGTLSAAGSSNFSLHVSSFCLGVGIAVSEATCVGPAHG